MTRKSTTGGQRAYHHGDLQRAIVDAALEALAETQSTEFSLRELARRAGVSHNAPYKHFADKLDLLAAVSAAGFDELTRKMGEAARRPAHPRARLMAMARSHIRHGVDNPALYRLMFGGYLTDGGNARPAVELGAATRLRRLIEDAFVDGALGRPLPRTARNAPTIDSAILSYWAQVHGLTLLIVDRLVGPPACAETLVERALKTLIDGLANAIPSLPRDAWVGPRMVNGSDGG